MDRKRKRNGNTFQIPWPLVDNLRQENYVT